MYTICITQCSVISYAHITTIYIHGVVSSFTPFPIPPAPLAALLLLPFIPPFTYLAPSSCDRNRPPSSQVACELTLFAPPFTQLFRPSQLPRTPIAQRLTTTTLGLLRSHYAEHLQNYFTNYTVFSSIFRLRIGYLGIIFRFPKVIFHQLMPHEKRVTVPSTYMYCTVFL
jgi:hypothetical protein